MLKSREFSLPSEDVEKLRKIEARDDMHMILAHHAFHNPNLESITGLAHKLSHSFCNLSPQNLVPILCHPHKMVLNLKNRMTAISIAHLWSPSQGRAIASKLTELNRVKRRCAHRVDRLKTVLSQNGLLLQVESHSEVFGIMKAGSSRINVVNLLFWRHLDAIALLHRAVNCRS